MRKIILGYDGSDHASRALRRAAEIAKDDGEVTVIGVIDIPAQTGGHAPEPADLAEATELDTRLEEAKQLLAKEGITAQTVKGFGHPADAIVEEAERAGADLIIVGTRGRNLAERWLLGSVSTRVVQHAPCDVLVVR